MATRMQANTNLADLKQSISSWLWLPSTAIWGTSWLPVHRDRFARQSIPTCFRHLQHALSKECSCSTMCCASAVAWAERGSPASRALAVGYNLK